MESRRSKLFQERLVAIVIHISSYMLLLCPPRLLQFRINFWNYKSVLDIL
jgi:hypothetical protein